MKGFSFWLGHLYFSNWIISESLNINPPGPEQKRTVDLIDVRHQAKPIDSSQFQMKWQMMHSVGSGLSNKDAHGFCRNICYINSIIQILAVTAPFVQWLFTDGVDIQCEYSQYGFLHTQEHWNCSRKWTISFHHFVNPSVLFHTHPKVKCR